MRLVQLSCRLVAPGALLLFSFGCGNSEEPMGSGSLTPAVTQAADSHENHPEDAAPRVTAEDSIKLVKEGKAIVIDVRGTASYEAAHIGGALDIPLNKLEAGEFTGLPRDKKIIAYCT
ncbi:MAG: rhodanese-like domain-containing protein [Blastocatellia bacterium]